MPPCFTIMLQWFPEWSALSPCPFYFDLNVLSCHLLKDTAAHDYSSADTVARHPSHRQCFWPGYCSSRYHINHLCHSVFLLLCYGLWTNPKYPVLRDLPYAGSWPLHCHMCPCILDLWHHCDLHTASDAHFDWPSWCLRHLCCCMRHFLDLRVLEGSRNQGHAPGSYYRVLRCWCKACQCCKKRVIARLLFCLCNTC